MNRLSQEDVITKYSPTPDPLWTPEIEAEFFFNLPKRTHREAIGLDGEKEMLIKEFGSTTLLAQRMGNGYIATLGAILGEFAGADNDNNECLVSQRCGHLGTPDTIRTIQAQMFTTGLMVKKTRPQGRGFVGDVFIYSPRPVYRYRKATHQILEKAYRDSEGECLCPPLPVNLSHTDSLNPH